MIKYNIWRGKLMADQKRWKEMDILRGMAILMVLLYHSVIVFPLNLHEIQWCKTLHTFLWTVQMPLFFLVSGFCYSFHGGYWQYALRKCRRILIPHVVFSLLDILPRLIPNPFVNERMNAKEALVDFVLYGGSDWFLWTLFVIVMVFPALERLLVSSADGVSREGAQRRQKLCILFVVLLFVLKPYVTDLLLLNMVSQYLWYFLIGYGLRRKADRLLPVFSRKQYLFPAVVVMGLCFAGMMVFGGDGRWELPYRYLEVLCVFAGFLFFYGLACMCRGKIGAFLVSCGTWSLQMYLFDAYALVATRTLLVSVLHVESPVLIIGGNFIMDTAIVLAVSRYIITKAKVFRICCGIPEKG